MDKDINITGFGYYADNYAVLEQILKKFYAMDISVRNVQRLIYGEIAPLKSIYESIMLAAAGRAAATLAVRRDIQMMEQEPKAEQTS